MDTVNRTRTAMVRNGAPAGARAHWDRRTGRRGWSTTARRFAHAAPITRASDAESCYVLGYN